MSRSIQIKAASIRHAAAIALLLLGASVGITVAAGWTRYENTRFGFVVDVPPRFERRGASDGDTQVFVSPDASQVLTVEGGSVLPGSFDDVWNGTQAAYREAGWDIRYEPEPPDWTSFSGTNGNRSLYVKIIPLCGGTKQFAMLALEYLAADAVAVEPTIEKLASSLKATGTGLSC